MAKVILDVDKAISKRVDANARKYLCTMIIRLSDPYVPYKDGHLKNTNAISPDGKQISYNAIYARRHWYNDYSPNYSKNFGGTRGPRWTERMMANRKNEVIESLEDYIRGKS